MKKILFTLLLILSTCTSIETFAKSGEQLDQVIAVINDDVITQTELNHALTLGRAQVAQQHIQMTEDAIKKQVLDQLINRKLQLQIAKQSGVTATQKDVELAIERIAKQNSMTSAELYKRLEQDGMSKKDYQDEIRDQITMRKLQQQEAVKTLNVSEQEITAFMRSKAWQVNELKEYKLEDTLVPVSDNPTPNEIATAKKRADAVLAKLNQGKSFAEILQAEPKDQPTLQNGDLGWRKLPEIPSAFAEIVATLQKNQVANPIQTSNGFHLVRLTDVRSISESKAPTRKQVQQLLMQRKFEEAVNVWISKLRGQSFIKTDTPT